MIHDRLKKIRKSKGLTQKAFSKIYNTTQQAVSSYEKGALQIPDKLKQLLYKDGINLNWLITGKEQMIQRPIHQKTKRNSGKIDKLREVSALYSEGIIDDNELKLLKKEIFDS